MAVIPVRGLLIALFVGSLAVAGQTFQELFRNGLVALQRNDLEAAELSLRSAAELEPKNARVWVALSQTLWKRKDAVKAEEAAGKASGLAGQDSVVLRSLVIYYSESSQLLKAAEAQARFAAANPEDAGAQENAAAMYTEATQALLRKEKFGEVVAALEAAPRAIAESAQLKLLVGVAYYGLRRFDEAAQAFLAVIALDASLKQPYVFLGKMLEQIPARLDEVTQRFTAYEHDNPADFEGYLLHAKALDARAVDPEAARKLLDKAIAMEPGSADAHFELGSLLDRMQKFAESAAEFERAAALNPADAAVHYRLSRLYQRLNKPEAAIAEREQHRKMVMAQNTAR